MAQLWKMGLLVAVVFVLGADKAEPEPKKVKPPKADVRGTVKSVGGLRAKDFIGRMLIIGKKEKDTSYDRASVILLSGAKIEKWVGGKRVKAGFGDIKAGCVVQCVFTGPVAESYPVQARTKEVLILETPKK